MRLVGVPISESYRLLELSGMLCMCTVTVALGVVRPSLLGSCDVPDTGTQ